MQQTPRSLSAAVLPDVDRIPSRAAGWLRGSLDAAESGSTAVFVAEDETGAVIGAVTVTERAHFAGEVDAYIGELVVQANAARRGAGRALVAAAENWAGERGLTRITLDTGAANTVARRFYAALGYMEEDIRLTRAIGAT
jgi:aminoglycoside 6'-N-acetyltransferase I